jgi:hypothetical protein
MAFLKWGIRQRPQTWSALPPPRYSITRTTAAAPMRRILLLLPPRRGRSRDSNSSIPLLRVTTVVMTTRIDDCRCRHDDDDHRDDGAKCKREGRHGTATRPHPQGSEKPSGRRRVAISTGDDSCWDPPRGTCSTPRSRTERSTGSTEAKRGRIQPSVRFSSSNLGVTDPPPNRFHRRPRPSRRRPCGRSRAGWYRCYCHCYCRSGRGGLLRRRRGGRVVATSTSIRTRSEPHPTGAKAARNSLPPVGTIRVGSDIPSPRGCAWQRS